MCFKKNGKSKQNKYNISISASWNILRIFFSHYDVGLRGIKLIKYEDYQSYFQWKLMRKLLRNKKKQKEFRSTDTEISKRDVWHRLP